MYINNLAIYLDASKERILKEYKKNYKLEKIPRARVTCPLASAPADATPAFPTHTEKFGEQNRSLLNEISVAAASTNDTCMIVVKDRPAEAKPPPHTYNSVDAAL